MNTRDDFAKATKRALELRANSCCSFTGCVQITSGPSAESPEAVNNTGVAAHIHGAASGRGSRRYLLAMTSEERSHISNGIWLCTIHADLIDGDEETYTADALRRMKREHEDKIQVIQRDRVENGQAVPDLIAVGNTIFAGDLVNVERGKWSVRVYHFVDGTLIDLINFIDRFDQINPFDRSILINALGEGRLLREPPFLSAETSGNHILHCPIAVRAARISVSALPADLPLGDNHDLVFHNGGIAPVSGVDALPQKIKMVLSIQRGEIFYHPHFGARVSEYYANFGDTHWFAQLLKLELIRQAAIPYEDNLSGSTQTPLLCVERVVQVEALASEPVGKWLPIRVTLEINGISGEWIRDLSVYVTDKTSRALIG